MARLALFACLLAAVAVAASAGSLEAKHWFPENPTAEFFPGKPTTAVLGVRNVGDSTLNLTAAGANLASPFNASINIYNFTTSFYNNQPLQPGEEANLEYRLHFPFNLPPRDFILKLVLFYGEDELIVPQLVFNGTIDVIEEPKLIDTQLISLYLILLGLIAGAGFLVFEWAKSKGWIPKGWISKKGKAKSSGNAAVDKSEWLKGTAWEASNKKKKQG